MPKKNIKQGIAVITGAFSALFGSAGAAITGFGLCPCVLATTFSAAGIVAVVFSFLSENSNYFLAAGVVLLAGSLILRNQKKTCKVHPIHSKKSK